jgi:hypothetical protein
MSDTPDTVFVRGTGGAIFEMDIPTNTQARERYDAAIEKGDLVIVPAAHWVERGDGSKYLVAGEPEGAAKPKASRSRAPRPAPDAAPPASEPEVEVEDPSKWTKAQCVDWLTEAVIEFDPKAKVGDLRQLVADTMAADAAADGT